MDERSHIQEEEYRLRKILDKKLRKNGREERYS